MLNSKYRKYNMSLGFFIPFELPALNQYINACKGNKHWSSKIKRDVERKIVAAVINRKKDFLTLEYPLSVTFTWHCKNRMKDPDNIAFGRKFIFDALCGADLLEGDGWKQVRQLHDYFPEPRKDHVGVWVEVEKFDGND